MKRQQRLCLAVDPSLRQRMGEAGRLGYSVLTGP